MLPSFVSRMRSSITTGGLVSLAVVVIGLTALLSTPRAVADQSAAATAADTYRMDTSFSTVIEADRYSLYIYDVKTSADGGFFVAGDFSTIGGQFHLGLAKFKADGTVDSNFNRDGGFNGRVDCIEVQPDGRLLVAGTFTSFNGTARPGLARLNTDGTLDTTFVPNSAVGSPSKIAMQSDGRILLSDRIYTVAWAVSGTNSSGGGTIGSRTFVSGLNNASTPTLSLSRINADGSADSTFNPPTISNEGYLSCFTLQSDGKILVGGSFTTIGNSVFHNIARLNANGSVDSSFATDSTSTFAPTAIAIRSDGKIVAGSSEYLPVGSGYSLTNYLVRLTASGSTDTTFHSTLSSELALQTLRLQPDGKIVIGANPSFAVYGVEPSSMVTRLNADGSADSSFAPPSLGYFDVSSLALQTDGRIVAGGSAYSRGSVSNTGLLRLTPNGTPESLAISNVRAPAGQVTAVPLANGKFLVGGYFNWVNGVSRNCIARLNANGSVDTAFNPGSGFDGTVGKFVVQPDGKILVLGSFSSFNGAICPSVIRLNFNGTQDTSFVPSLGGIYDAISDLVLQPDGKIVFGGYLYPGSAMRRLNPDGSDDSSFNASFGSSNYSPSVHSLALQPDGKIVVGGNFQYSLALNDTVTHNNIVRLSSNGSIDPTFNPGTGPDSDVSRVMLNAGGQIMIDGFFSNYNGAARHYLARIQPLGNLDTTFNADTALGFPQFFAVQADQRVIVSAYGLLNTFARLNTDGSIDASFKTYDFNGFANSVSFTDDGRFLVGGGIALGNTTTQVGLTILKADGSTNPPGSTTPDTPQPAPAGGGGGGAPSVWFEYTAIALLVGRLSQKAAKTKKQS